MTTDTVGGVLTYVTELVRGLGPDAEVVVAAMGRPMREDQRISLRNAGAARIHEAGYGLEWMADPWEEVEAAGRWLLDLERREQPDVIHLNGYAHGALPWMAPCVVVGHSCVLSWWSAVHGTSAPPSWSHYRGAVQHGLRGAVVVVAPTETMLDELERLYGEWPGEARVIHNGSPAARPSELVAKQALILAAGRLWDEAKNLTVLDRAAAGLDWPVVVAGALRSPAGFVASPAHVTVAGELGAAELGRLRRGAAVFAAPALYEPFGLAILEAARDSCALVLGDIPSLRELWDGAAWFVDPHDHRALHAALRDLGADSRLREQLATAARRRSSSYDVATMSAGYRELYARLPDRAGALG